MTYLHLKVLLLGQRLLLRLLLLLVEWLKTTGQSLRSVMSPR